MKYIGFTTKYYTLWDVSSDDKYTYYNYIKNISMDFEKAKMKEPTAMIDLSIHGHSSYKVENYIKVDCFQFGKYKGKKYADCEDYDYMMWYHNMADNDNTKKNIRPYLLEHGYKLWADDNKIVTDEQYKRNEFLKANMPKFQAKIENHEPFKFKCEKNVSGRIDSDNEEEIYYGVLDIPFCNIVFPRAIQQTWKDYTYYLPTIHEFSMEGIRIKNTIVCIDDYIATRIDSLTYKIIVVNFHTEDIKH